MVRAVLPLLEPGLLVLVLVLVQQVVVVVVEEEVLATEQTMEEVPQLVVQLAPKHDLLA